MERLPDTWADRDYPVLLAIVKELEEAPGNPLDGYRLATSLTMDELDVARALSALDGEYIRRHSEGSLDGSPDFGVILDVTGAARRAVGVWPTPESVADELLTSLDERIAQEAEGEQKSRLVKIRDAIGGTTRDLFVDVAGSVLSRALSGM